MDPQPFKHGRPMSMVRGDGRGKEMERVAEGGCGGSGSASGFHFFIEKH
jgi:hypothetical protein